MNINDKIYLMTQTLKLKDVFPDMAGAIAKKYKMKEEDVQFIRKGITPSDMELVEGERASIDYITTGSVDRDGEIVDPSGAILKDYKKHPVVLFGHDYSQLPVGKSEWIKSDEKGLISKTIYATHEKAEEVWQYRKAGFPLAKSIGFVPVDWEDLTEKQAKDLNKEGARRIYKKWLMLEYSDVSVPSNPDALQISISKGLVKDKTGTEFYSEDVVCEVTQKMIHEKEIEMLVIAEKIKEQAIKDDLVKRWIQAQMGWLLGSRNDLTRDPDEKQNQYEIYSELYLKYEMAVPELKEYDQEELKSMFHDVWFDEIGELVISKMAEEDLKEEKDPSTDGVDGERIQAQVDNIKQEMEKINLLLN